MGARRRGHPMAGQEFRQPIRKNGQEHRRQRTPCLGTSPHRLPAGSPHNLPAQLHPPQKRRRGRQQTGGLQADEGAASKHRSFSRADSKSYQGYGFGCRRTIASSAVMSCITACMPARIDSKPLSRSRFRAAVRSVAIAPARLPR